MPDASIRIDGRTTTDAPRFGDYQGKPVANLAVAAGRSRKNEQTGQWETLSATFYDIAFWDAHHDLIAGLNIGKGDSVVITGNVTGIHTYTGQDGTQRETVKVTGHGIQHFPKRDQGQQGYAPQQSQGFQQAPAQQAPASNGWGQVAQPGQGQQQGYGAGTYDDPPFAA